MSLDRIFNVVGAIITVALVTTIVAHRGSARVITASGKAIVGALRTAMGG